MPKTSKFYQCVLMVFPASRLPIRPTLTKSFPGQKILSAEFYSFSFFWLLFILILGLVIIIISFTIDMCLRCSSRKWNWQNYQQLEWTTSKSTYFQGTTSSNCSYFSFSMSVAKATVIVVTIGLLYVRTVRGGQMTVELLMHE
jgi:hypothetical protein